MPTNDSSGERNPLMPDPRVPFTPVKEMTAMSTHIATALDTVPDAAIDALSLRLEDRAPVLILAFASPKQPAGRRPESPLDALSHR